MNKEHIIHSKGNSIDKKKYKNDCGTESETNTKKNEIEIKQITVLIHLPWRYEIYNDYNGHCMQACIVQSNTHKKKCQNE